jgi:hypothetical protein
MTVLASTPEHLVEYEAGILTIARRSDGHCLALRGHGIAAHFRDCLTTHEPARVVAVFIKLCRGQHWRPLYKPRCMAL